MTGYINVMLVLQSCTDSLHILPHSSSDTYGTSSDCTYHGGNVKVEGDLDMQGEVQEVNVKTEKVIGGEEVEYICIEDEDIYSEQKEEEGEVNVKTEKDIGSEEEEGIGIEDEECICSKEGEEEKDIVIKEEEDEAIKEEDVHVKEESVDIKEEVSLGDTL